MAGRQHRDQFLLGQQALLHAVQRGAGRHADEGQVDAALPHRFQQALAVFLAQGDVDLRKAPVEGGQQLDDVEQVEGGDHPQGQAAAHLATDRGDFGGNPPGRFQRQARLAEQRLAGRRDPHLARPALEQPGAQLLLQAGDLVAERRLHHVAALRGAGEVAFLGEGDGEFELLEVHGLHRDTRLRSS